MLIVVLSDNTLTNFKAASGDLDVNDVNSVCLLVQKIKKIHRDSIDEVLIIEDDEVVSSFDQDDINDEDDDDDRDSGDEHDDGEDFDAG